MFSFLSSGSNYAAPTSLKIMPWFRPTKNPIMISAKKATGILKDMRNIRLVKSEYYLKPDT